MVRNLLDKYAPNFHKGGKWEKWFALYEAIDTGLFKPSDVTKNSSHVRDSIDLKRVMITVWLATFPTMFFGMWNVGFQANTIMAEMGMLAQEGGRGLFIGMLAGYDPASIWDNFVHGAAYFLPIYMVTFIVGGFWEVLFASVRGHEVNEGFFVTSVLFALCCPPDLPLWMVAMGISFGIVIGKEVFGGTGKNFLNPALTGRAFLYFAYPAYMSGDAVWTAVDGYTGATMLSVAASSGVAALEQSASWMQAFVGTIHGSIGETSTLAILIGAALLLVMRIASWRIMGGVLLGSALLSMLFNSIESTNPMFALPFYWHWVIGGFAFGAVFMATDPVSAAMTNTGKFWYGMLIGVMVILIRVVNPAFPEGMMLAILFANLFAPLIDHFVVQGNIKRRLARG
ncbi:MAG: NADH:ubiquinone reductase (Na(+)-transporting) subunit B [Porticoccaceae bacterium]|jgi:Na+-transporting NADH:ubiquinone oxidoreductase subunit B|nr:MAG: Na(+)-translocating NADH-quinone reductase subunit B [SAR92 bacterium BACL16 MAG-120619-bin48]MDP4655450.1 NADH:ubiquinone reductase (Na(+)-transporting) subunit B [Alphaproteobacteria bacterium]MDP4744655.1 NADH:ubiquinone reductase (Na(+)-transporting) subunit B [Porticoccaceae bacterium]MDP4753847.1 NADH:ubiquinone reductase (Na(+)-transporting) subunit B [Porticoccaceae bacterium]MDP4986650.1 NADH:ubiquinone reductase (Na(+)-transporting) subunit B [Porticoccaceae bacterium]